jgi:hypothetical protein
VEPVAELPEPVAVAEADPLLVPVIEVVRVQEHDVLKYAEENMAGLAESVPDTDAPVVVRGVFVLETDAGVEDEAATDAIRKSCVSSCNIELELIESPHTNRDAVALACVSEGRERG